MEMLLSVPRPSPSELMVALPTAGVVSPDASWVRPSDFPAVPRLRAMVLFDAPSFQPVIERVGEAGVVLASEPSLLKLIVIGVVAVVPVCTVESATDVGLPKLAVQAFVPVFVQVIWTELGVPRESYTVIELLNVSVAAASAGRFAEIVDFVVALALVVAISVLIDVSPAGPGSPTIVPLASVRHPCRKKPLFWSMPFLSGVKAP